MPQFVPILEHYGEHACDWRRIVAHHHDDVGAAVIIVRVGRGPNSKVLVCNAKPYDLNKARSVNPLLAKALPEALPNIQKTKNAMRYTHF